MERLGVKGLTELLVYGKYSQLSFYTNFGSVTHSVLHP